MMLERQTVEDAVAASRFSRRSRCLWASVALGVATIAGCSPAPLPAPAPSASPSAAAEPRLNADALVQFSLITALAAGDYSHGASLRDVRTNGDFGLGTFDQLDGEMILLDGELFQVRANGEVRTVGPEGSTPFAVVTFFEEDGRIENLNAESLESLDGHLDEALPRRNSPYALRIDGDFDQLTLRSVPAQQSPFPPLVDVVKTQAVWESRNVRGTLVGLRCPAWIGTLNVPGYHWHFISDDRLVGGHVLGCRFAGGLLRFDECTSVLIHIPQSEAFNEFDADRIRSQDIQVIERQRARSED